MGGNKETLASSFGIPTIQLGLSQLPAPHNWTLAFPSRSYWGKERAKAEEKRADKGGLAVGGGEGKKEREKWERLQSCQGRERENSEGRRSSTSES